MKGALSDIITFVFSVFAIIFLIIIYYILFGFSGAENENEVISAQLDEKVFFEDVALAFLSTPNCHGKTGHEKINEYLEGKIEVKEIRECTDTFFEEFTYGMELRDGSKKLFSFTEFGKRQGEITDIPITTKSGEKTVRFMYG